MKRCPITYDMIADHENYSQRGLRLLSPQLKHLNPLSFTADEQRKEALSRIGKMSIQGVQPKLSAQLNIKEEQFVIVDQCGHFILKPQSRDYDELPENEAVTMSLAALIDIDVPVHGLVYAKDNSMTYFIKRFDRYGHQQKLATEDFAQLSNEDRDTKYQSSMEKIIKIIDEFCTFPKIEHVKLFKLTLFNFLVGNEDMHLKNFSLITREQGVSLSPAYDLLNSTIALGEVKEELALPLNGKKNNLQKSDFLKYFALDRLALSQSVIASTLKIIREALPQWRALINASFLSQAMQARYLALLDERSKRLELTP